MKSIVKYFLMILSSGVFAEQVEFVGLAVKNIEADDFGLRSGFSYASVEFKLDGAVCRVYVPKGIGGAESTKMDNPYMRGQCERASDTFVQSTTHMTYLNYNKPSWGGLSSDIEIKFKLVNPSNGKFILGNVRSKVRGEENAIINDRD